MKRALFGAIVLFSIASLMVIAFFMFAPEDRTNAVKEAWRRTQKDKAQACLDDLRKTLKDPDSARIVSFGLVKEKSEAGGEISYYLLKYKAKNSFGAYSQDEQGYDCSGAECREDTLYNLNKQVKELKAKSAARRDK